MMRVPEPEETPDASEASSACSRKRSRSLSAPQTPPRRHSHRKTEGRVFFSDVMAQEREMERLNYEKSRGTQLRKGEKEPEPPQQGETAQRKKQKRVEERRSQRQALRRTMSPRSPDGGPGRPLRGGVSMVALDADAPTQRRRRYARDEDAIQDASLHATAWRNLRLDYAPVNVLPTRPGMLEPYALQMDAPLEEFDAELKDKCAVSHEALKPKPLTMATGSLTEARDRLQMEDRVCQLIEEATPLVKKCHAARANAVIANTRQQIAAYLEELPGVRAQASTLPASPLQISRLEKVAARRLLRNGEFAPEGLPRPHYSVGRIESDHSEPFTPEVRYLSTIAPIPRSTTCMLSRGTHRVEDDPIIRFVPYFTPGSNSKAQAPQFSGMERRKETLVGMDDEVNEYVLRYVVNACGSNQAVFEALQRSGLYAQPFANYADILTRVSREQLHTQCIHEFKALGTSQSMSSQVKCAMSKLLDDCKAVRAGAQLRGRLQPPPTHVVLNYLQQVECMGVRGAPSKKYKDLAVKYQEFFCRRCCSYSCRNHGREQPVPVVRVDPRYPVVKASSKLWRHVEKEQMTEERVDESIDNADVEMGEELGENISETVEPASEQAPVPDQSAETQPNSVQSELGDGSDDTSVGERTRRSMRAHTAASTKASLAHRSHDKKKFSRSKMADASEYLGFDSVYHALIHDKKVVLLSSEDRCGPNCSKPVSAGAQSDHSNGIDMSELEKTWKDSEIALLNKLELCVSPNPCILSALLATRTCSGVAEFLRQRENQEKAKGSFNDFDLLRSGLSARNRERTNGVLGNSHEHLRRTRFQRMKDRGANHEFVPCSHDGGSCDSAQCSCMRRDHYCEKSCGCSPDCSNRFPGCHCEVGQCRTSACPCYFASRECDPDVCVSCGASELPVIMADEESKSKSLAQLKICGNVSIMRGRMRKIGVAASKTHGWGAYALESVKSGEYMYEYTGSLLSQDEAERRGNVYDKATISFLFDLTEDSVVDATRKGNKSKFANHDSVDPKCFARIMLVNGDHRIGIYAKKDIKVGDELFFDYGYNGVIPDWSQARIGSGKNAPSIKEDSDDSSDTTTRAADIKREPES